MPNNVKNRIKLIGSEDQINEFVKAFTTHYPEKQSESFTGDLVYENNKGERAWLNKTTNTFNRRNKPAVNGILEGFMPVMDKAYDHFPDFEKVIPQPDNIFNESLGRDEIEMCKREGRPTWYDWNRENWGTKWNSYSCDKESFDTFTFETAWCAVPLIIEAMSRKFPDVDIIYSYADEDTGYNCGKGICKNGELFIKEMEEGSKEAYELAFELRPEDKEYYELVERNYKPKED